MKHFFNFKESAKIQELLHFCSTWLILKKAGPQSKSGSKGLLAPFNLSEAHRALCKCLPSYFQRLCSNSSEETQAPLFICVSLAHNQGLSHNSEHFYFRASNHYLPSRENEETDAFAAHSGFLADLVLVNESWECLWVVTAELVGHRIKRSLQRLEFDLELDIDVGHDVLHDEVLETDSEAEFLQDFFEFGGGQSRVLDQLGPGANKFSRFKN